MVTASIGVAACGSSSKEGSSASGSASGPITFVTWGGALEQAQQQAMATPFTKESGIKVNTTAPTDYAKLKALGQGGSGTWDVVDAEPHVAATGCREGWLEKLDFNVIDRNAFLPTTPATDCSVPTGSYPFAIAYRTDKFASGHPQNWADFFNTERFPGKRTMTSISPIGVLEPALLADGVKPADLYPIDVDRALRKLDTIKKDIVWWSTGDQSEQLLSSGEAVLCACWSTRAYDAKIKLKAPVAMEWNQQLVGYDVFVVPKGSKHAKAVNEFLKFVSQPAQQLALSKITPWGPSVTDAASQASSLPTKDWIPTTPEHLKLGVPIDYAWWADNYETIGKRFQQWLIQ
jgi:putative spermidine/putrescine transport system substrate-binding protein